MNENTLVNKPSIQNKNSYNKNKWRKIRQAISTEIRVVIRILINTVTYGTKYSRTDQVKFVKDSL